MAPLCNTETGVRQRKDDIHVVLDDHERPILHDGSHQRDGFLAVSSRVIPAVGSSRRINSGSPMRGPLQFQERAAAIGEFMGGSMGTPSRPTCSMIRPVLALISGWRSNVLNRW